LPAKRQFLNLLKEQFNIGIKYKVGTQKWDTVILRKTQELAKFLSGQTKIIDFTEPSPTLERTDSQELRNRILKLSQSEAKDIGIGKSTLHYLRKHARENKSFKVYSKVTRKISVAKPETSSNSIPDS
jgi:CRISPR-associated protein Cas1